MSIKYGGKYTLPKITDKELVEYCVQEYVIECYTCKCVFDYEDTMTKCPECSALWH